MVTTVWKFRRNVLNKRRTKFVIIKLVPKMTDFWLYQKYIIKFVIFKCKGLYIIAIFDSSFNLKITFIKNIWSRTHHFWIIPRFTQKNTVATSLKMSGFIKTVKCRKMRRLYSINHKIAYPADVKLSYLKQKVGKYNIFKIFNLV